MVERGVVRNRASEICWYVRAVLMSIRSEVFWYASRLKDQHYEELHGIMVI